MYRPINFIWASDNLCSKKWSFFVKYKRFSSKSAELYTELIQYKCLFIYFIFLIKWNLCNIVLYSSYYYYLQAYQRISFIKHFSSRTKYFLQKNLINLLNLPYPSMNNVFCIELLMQEEKTNQFYCKKEVLRFFFFITLLLCFWLTVQENYILFNIHSQRYNTRKDYLLNFLCWIICEFDYFDMLCRRTI